MQTDERIPQEEGYFYRAINDYLTYYKLPPVVSPVRSSLAAMASGRCSLSAGNYSSKLQDIEKRGVVC